MIQGLARGMRQMLDLSTKDAEKIHGAGLRAEGGHALADNTTVQGREQLENADEILGHPTCFSLATVLVTGSWM